MKYTLEGFSQEQLVKLGLDATDAIILRWFVDFSATGKMSRVYDSGKEFWWVKYSAIIDDLPILGISTTKNIGRHFQKMVDCGLMEQFIKKCAGGTFSCFRLIEDNYINLVSDYPQKSHATGQESPVPQDIFVPTKDSSTNYSSTTNPSTIKEPRAGFTSTDKVKLGFGVNKDVMLTQTEYDRLVSDYGPDTTNKAIDFLSNYFEEKPKYKRESKSHNATLRRWVFDAIKGRANYAPSASNGNGYAPQSGCRTTASFSEIYHED